MSVDEIVKCAFQMTAFEEYFPVVMIIVLNKVVLTFGSVDEILNFDN